MRTVYIVTFWDNNEEEPCVAPFDNKEAARKCYEAMKKEHYGCCIDKCKVFHSFFSTDNK